MSQEIPQSSSAAALEERAYTVAYEEAIGKRPRSGLWAKSLVEADGDERKAELIYTKRAAADLLKRYAEEEALGENALSSRSERTAPNRPSQRPATHEEANPEIASISIEGEPAPVTERSPREVPRDLSWGIFLAVLSVLLVVLIVFTGTPSGRHVAGKGLIVADDVGRFIGCFIGGAFFIFAPMAIYSRSKYGLVATPRRDLLIGAGVGGMIYFVVQLATASINASATPVAAIDSTYSQSPAQAIGLSGPAPVPNGTRTQAPAESQYHPSSPSLPTLPEFLAAARPVNKGESDADLTSYWWKKYGSQGASVGDDALGTLRKNIEGTWGCGDGNQYIFNVNGTRESHWPTSPTGEVAVSTERWLIFHSGATYKLGIIWAPSALSYADIKELSAQKLTLSANGITIDCSREQSNNVQKENLNGNTTISTDTASTSSNKNEPTTGKSSTLEPQDAAMARDLLAKRIPNWFAIAGPPGSHTEYREWLARQPQDYQRRINDSWDANEIADSIEKFMADTGRH